MLNFPKDNWLHLTFKLHQTSEFLLLESWSNMFSFKTINQKNLLFFNVQISVGWGGIASTSPHQRSGWIRGLEYYQPYLNLTCLMNLLKAAKNSHVIVVCHMGVIKKVYNFLLDILASFIFWDQKLGHTIHLCIPPIGFTLFYQNFEFFRLITET